MYRKKKRLFIFCAALVFVCLLSAAFFMWWICGISPKTLFVIGVPMILYVISARLFTYGTKALKKMQRAYIPESSRNTDPKAILRAYMLSACVCAPHYLSWAIMSVVPLEGLLGFMTLFPTAFISGFSFVPLSNAIKDITKRQFPFWIIQIVIFTIIFTVGRQFAFSMIWAGMLTS